MRLFEKMVVCTAMFFVFTQTALGGEWSENIIGGNALKFELPNGMTVILEENRSAPVVAFQAWVNVGSTDETPELAGMAHVHEHMLFKGTKKRGVGQISMEVEAAGGDINAWTSFEQTVYHLVLASRFFDTGLDILADALRNSTFDAEELKREIEVVREEIKRGKDQPYRKVSESYFSLAYQKHPYGRPVIGYDEVVAKFSREQILSFYRKWYVPNNMTFVVVGDFDAKKAQAKIRKAFAGYKKGVLPRAKKAKEPDQSGIRVDVLRDEVQETYIEFGVPTVEISHPDTPALDLLSMVLSHGDSSRLNQNIKEQKGLVNSISAYSFTPKDKGAFLMHASLADDKLGEALKQSVYEMARLTHDNVTAEELRRAKINMMSDAIYEKETVEGQARKLAFFQTVYGDLEAEKRYYDRIEAMTVEDLRMVAQKYFSPEKVTVSVLLPKAKQTGLSKNEIKKWVKEGFDLAKKEKKSLAKVKDLEVQEFKLSNGIKILVRENHRLPILSIKAVSLGGLRFETPETNGLSGLMAGLWTKGTKTRSALEIAKTAESMAGHVSALSGRNSLGLNMDILSQFSEEGLALFCDVLRNPSFDAKELEIERRHTLEAIRTQEDNLAGFTFKNFFADLYGSHPYALDPLGKAEKVAKYTSEDVRVFYRKIVKPDNLVIVIVGNVDAQEIKQQLEKHLGNWKEEPFQDVKLPPIVKIEQEKTNHIVKDKNQAHLVYGFLGTTLHSEDRYALEVLRNVLSGMGGRLFLQLRDRQSLAYTVTFMSQEGVDPGFMGVYMGTDPKKLDEAMASIRAELKKLIDEKVPKAEIDKAKKNIVGSFEIDLQRSSAQAGNYAYNALYGLGWDDYKRYINNILKVSADDVQRVAKKYITMDRPVVTFIGPASAKTAGAETMEEPQKKVVNQ